MSLSISSSIHYWYVLVVDVVVGLHSVCGIVVVAGIGGGVDNIGGSIGLVPVRHIVGVVVFVGVGAIVLVLLTVLVL